MSRFRKSTIIMAVCSLVMLIGLIFPYVQNTESADITASVFDIMSGGGDSEGLVDEKAKTVYTIIAAGVAATALFGLLSLSSKKVFGVFTIIFSLLVALFHGFLLPQLSERSLIKPGIGYWFILLASLILWVTSIVFVSRKRKTI